MNSLILQQTTDTVVTFIYLPPPPKDDGAAEDYFRKIDVISKNLPPSIFVHGVSVVNTTSL